MAVGPTYLEGQTGNLDLSDLSVDDENITATDLESALSELASRIDTLETA